MWRITLPGLLAHKVRYALTALAVVLGVAFIAGTLIFTDTIKRTFDGLFDDVYQNTAAVVRAEQPVTSASNFTDQRRWIDAALVRDVRRVPGVAQAEPGVGGYAQLVGRDGKAIGNPAAGAPTLGEAWSSGADSMQPYRFLPGGRPPATADEVAIDKHSADVGHLAVGDRVVVLTKRAPREYTITGIVRWGTADSPLGASITLFDLPTAERVLTAPGKVNEIDVAAENGVSQQELVDRIRSSLATPHLEVVTGAKVIEEGQSGIRKALTFFDTFLFVFAGVALFVGSFLIFNTFSIVVAQRMRELALLRAVGAGRAQVMRSVLGESLAIGLVASLIGLGAGVALAVGLRGLLTLLGFGIPAAGLTVLPRTVVVSVFVGTLITLLAALVPAWKAGRIAPVAALRTATVGEETRKVRRTVSSSLVLAVGTSLLLLGLFADVPHRIAYVGAGAAVLFVGVAVAGPLISRPLSRVLGAPLRWLGPAGLLARSNAMQSPKRTSAAAAALMVGVSLVALIAVMASSTKASVASVIDSSMRADFVIGGGQPGGASGFSPSLQRTITALPQIESATGVRSGTIRVGGSTTLVLAVDPRHVDDLFDVDVRQGSFSDLGPQQIAISQQVADSRHLAVGDRIPVAFTTTGAQTFTVGVVYGARQLAGDYVLPLAAAERNFTSQLDFQVYAKLAPGVSASAGRSAIERVIADYPNATLMDRTQYKHEQEAQIDQLLNLMYGLLGLALVIALVGIANTLALSIYERTHELGLLRAVGMTRPQLRRSVRAEAVIIALLGTVEGLALGTLLGWAVVRALHSQGVTILSVPVTQLAVVAVLAAAAGVVAATAPGRRAARLDVLAAISRH
ncbi:MAG: ABC transporter permease [Nocardioides sp.]